ncbi:hypothetical protein CALVIDRAFT_319709 [Calocera viscosa TUFC12733]|uniref:Uncharacterized protein n=1 Tax=Calocera viscosa (strain TUFC12733) TaxID=1330018 RepID=A0A167QKJ0_CALVF|nr:hypothetical protein CALVIDRAFT_319709 [Calocera viscosa TUFC12733]
MSLRMLCGGGAASICPPYRTTIVQMSTVSPISKIPDELLSDIFEAAMQEAQDALFSFAMQRTTGTEELHRHNTMTLFSINAVCRHWRRVALVSPRLWTTIVVPLHPRWPPGYRMTLLFERSATCPLSVYATRVEPLQDLCDPLRTYSVLDRVTRLSLQAMDDERYLALRQLRFTRLEDLQIGYLGTRGSIKSMMAHFHLWLQIHSSLRILKLNASCFQWMMAPGLAAMTLPNLELLSLTQEAGYIVERFSKLVSAPKLLELRLRNTITSGYASLCLPPDTMFHVRRLVLARGVPAKYLENLSSLLPNIQVLQLSNPRESEHYFSSHTRLIQLLTKDSTFPLLRTLSLHRMHIRHDRLQQFVESRASPCPAVFRTLQLSQCTFYMEEDEAVDLDLQLHGIKLEGWTPLAD